MTYEPDALEQHRAELFSDLLELEEGELLLHGIAVIAYLDKNGERRIYWQLTGEPQLDQTLGLISRLEHQLQVLGDSDGDV